MEGAVPAKRLCVDSFAINSETSDDKDTYDLYLGKNNISEGRQTGMESLQTCDSGFAELSPSLACTEDGEDQARGVKRKSADEPSPEDGHGAQTTVSSEASGGSSLHGGTAHPPYHHHHHHSVEVQPQLAADICRTSTQDDLQSDIDLEDDLGDLSGDDLIEIGDDGSHSPIHSWVTDQCAMGRDPRDIISKILGNSFNIP